MSRKTLYLGNEMIKSISVNSGVIQHILELRDKPQK